MLGLSKEDFERYCLRLREKYEETKRRKENEIARQTKMKQVSSFLQEYKELMASDDKEMRTMIEAGMREIQRREAI